MKNTRNRHSLHYSFKKPQRTDLLSIIFILSFCLVSFNSYGQANIAKSQKVTLNIENKQLSQILNEISTKTGFIFFFNDDYIKDIKNVNINCSDCSIQEALNKLLADTDLVYTIENKQVYLNKKANIKKTTAPKKEIAIKGVIKDSNNEPIIGANITIKGSGTGTISDIDGQFTLPNVEEGASVIISYIGFSSQTIKAGNKSFYDIILKDDQLMMDEVVVVGYGTQKKSDLTGAISNISSDKLNTQSNINIGQALQGKIAGVDIVSQGGAPGSGLKIMVRGIGTFGNSAPLYIVDGMYMGGIDHLNPNDIATIDVLKDASASAIYGSRAANGVIIITTKEGSDTEGKPIVDISANVGVQIPNKHLKMMNKEQWANAIKVSREAINQPNLEMAMDLESKPDNDWQKELLKPAITHNYNVGIKGGGKSYKYYTGLGYYNQDGVVKNTNYERYNIQFKSDFQRGILKAGTNIIFNISENAPLLPYARGGILGVILQSVPTLEKYDENRKGGYGGTYGEITDLPNPLGACDNGLMQRKQNNLDTYINIYMELDLYKGLKYKLNLTPDYHTTRYFEYQNIYDFGTTTNEKTSVTDDRNNSRNLLVEHLLTYDQTFGKHKLSSLLGYTFQTYKNRYLLARGQGMPEGIKEINAATLDRVNDGSLTRSTLISYLARIFYSYKDKYLLTATLRRDGSSKFGKDNRYGNFPSVSVGWNISEETFLKKLDWLDQLKIRGGYGVLGNQSIGDYNYSSYITTGINYPDGEGGLLQGAFPKYFSNPNIKWEETSMTNIGVDFKALRTRLGLTLDYYIKDTKDVLLNVPIPISTGGANDPIKNAAKIRNKGFEFSLSWNDMPTDKFSYGINVVGSILDNEVTRMGTGTQAIWGGATQLNVNTSKTLAGYPIGGFWLIPTDGYFQNQEEINAHSKEGQLIQPEAAPGDIRFMDTNGDGIINDDDRVYKGSPFAKWNMAINGNITYKDFDFLIGIQGVFGNKIYNATKQTLEGVNKGTNFLRSVTDYWTPQNPNASHPRLIWDDPNRNNRPESDRYLESGRFIRVRNIQLGYNIPTSLFQDKINKARIYLNIENPFTFTNYSGYSPDVNSGSATSRGFDFFIYPTNRVFMLGLNVSF